MDYKDYIRVIPDFPKAGISFKDITPLLQNGKVLNSAIKDLSNHYVHSGIDIIAGPEARGFLLGVPMAYELGVGFVPVRKPGKLPAETIQEKYELEYGFDMLEMHKDALQPGQKVLIADDLLATGGTALTTAKLVEKLGGIVAGFCFIIELGFLQGRSALKDYNITSLVKYY